MEAVGRLAGGVAHDFNNLLTAILGYAELLLDSDPSPEVKHSADEIRKAGERAAALTKQLLAFSRKQVLQPKILDLNEVLAEVDGMLRRTLGEDVTYEAERDPHLWRVQADPGQLQQVLLNLAVNARDAMPEGGVLRIATRNVSLRAGEPPGGSEGRRRGLRAARGLRHRPRDGRRDPFARLRAFLHDERERQGHGPRALDGLRDREAERRLHSHRERAREGDARARLPDARPRRRGLAFERDPALPAARGHGDDPARRGRGIRAPPRLPPARAERLSPPRRVERGGGARDGARIRGTDRPAPHRRRPARPERPAPRGPAGPRAPRR